jgi:prolyl oligopeptidase
VLNASSGAGFLFAEYMVDAISRVTQFDLKGRMIRNIELPDLGTASGFGGEKDQEALYFTFTNYRIAPAIFALDPKRGETTLYRASQSPFDGNRFKTEQVFFNSKDGTRIPMIITYAKGTRLNGTTPTLLSGYGGFDISIRPRFSSTVAAWLELGGIYAVPNIRGGGEYGKRWHIAGTKTQKQNVFDDFIAAAEFLIDEGYTSKERLAVSGRSNGGLLVGAVTTQRPDLFQVALPGVGVLDMLRYHTFTAGAGWAYDYGTSQESEAMFKYLLSYSPLHNTKPGINYPATLITTAERDDRVVPAHSYKFAAQLQHDHAGDSPILIRIDSNAGHGAGTPIDKLVDQYADIYSFTLKNMGIEKIESMSDAL